MTQRTTPPFRADHVGSLLRPAALKKARERRAKGEIDAAALKEVEDREIERVIEKQEEVGLNAITDGEFRRSWWHLDFLWGLDGIEKHVMDTGIAFAGVNTRNEGLKVTGKIGFSGHPMIEHFKFVAAHTSATPKITNSFAVGGLLGGRCQRRSTRSRSIPSSMLSSTISARPIKKPCAPSPMPVAAICSSTRCSLPCCATRNTGRRSKARGDDPEKLGAALRRSHQRWRMSDIPPDMRITMHLCRGNYKSTFMGTRRLRGRAGNPVRPHQGARLFHGIRHRARGRLRAAAPGAEGPPGRARPRHHQERPAGEQGRDQAPHRGSREVHFARPALPFAAMRLRLHRRGQCAGGG